MKSRLLSLLLLSLASSAASARADIAWESDYASARAKSQATGKPLFIDVYTVWCGWCKKLDSDVYPDPRVQQLAGNFIMLKLNAEGNGRAFAQSMHIHSYPNLMFASARGEQLYNVPGFTETSDFLSLMQDAIRRNGPVRPARHSTKMPAMKAAAAPRRMSLAPGARNWKKQPELKRVVTVAGYGGALLLGDGGIVKVDQSSARKQASKRTKIKARTTR